MSEKKSCQFCTQVLVEENEFACEDCAEALEREALEEMGIDPMAGTDVGNK